MSPISPFTLRLPAQVRFGRGVLDAAAPGIAAFGPRLILVHGASPMRSAPLRHALEDAGCDVMAIPCAGEPTLPRLEATLVEARGARANAVVAMGGGAALDLGKALAALLPSAGPPRAYLEIVGDGRRLDAPPLPLVAIPTTAGTGSEATKNAVIAVPDAARKVSLRDDRMVPALAVIDPSLTDGTPAAQTLASGLDAVVQVIEPYLSRRATPFTDALARPAITDGLAALAQLVDRGEDPDARDRIAHTAFVSGIALAHAGLGAVHGLAGVLGGETEAPHGALCARLLPAVLRALDRDLAPDAPQRSRLTEVNTAIDTALPGGRPRLDAWMTAHGVPPLPCLSQTRCAHVAAEAARSSSIKASPVAFSNAALAAILDDAMASGAHQDQSPSL